MNTQPYQQPTTAITLNTCVNFVILTLLSSLALVSFESKASNIPKKVEVVNFPTTAERIQVRGHMTTGTTTSGGNNVAVFLQGWSINDMVTNYGVVLEGKKLVITDIIARHAISDTSGYSNFILYSKDPGSDCGPGTARSEWSMFVPQGVSTSSHLTTGIEIPEGRIMCAGSTGGISITVRILGYVTDK